MNQTFSRMKRVFSVLKVVALLNFMLCAIFIYNYRQIYVPDNFESPIFYKCVTVVIKLASFLAHCGDLLGYSHQATLLRSPIQLINFTYYFCEPHEKIKIVDKEIQNIPVRIYSPENWKEASPAIIYLHGGAFMSFSVDFYNFFIYELATALHLPVIAIDYRYAPEYSYPIPIDDCYEVIKHIFENAKEYKIDPEKVVFLGDSSGGNIIAVMTQRLIKQNSNHMPKLQMLIYPWIQLHNYASPSYEEYYDKTYLYEMFVPPGRFALWYLGKTDITTEMEEQIVSTNIFYLIKDKEQRKKYISMQIYHNVPNEYKEGKSYYEKFEHRHLHDFDIDHELDENHILIRDKELNSLALKLLSEDVSPGLADDKIIKKLPKTFMIVCEWDILKDQQLLFAERLKKNGVDVTVAFFERGFHGTAFFISEFFGFQTAQKQFKNLVEFIQNNI